MKYWEIIADNPSKAGWSWGYVSAIDSNGRTIWIADAYREGKRFVVYRRKTDSFSRAQLLGRGVGVREIGLVFSRVVRSKLRQCGNLREDVRENVGAQNFVFDIWNRLLAS